MSRPGKFGSLPASQAALLGSFVVLSVFAAAGPASAACGVVAHTTGIQPATAHTGASSGVHAPTGSGGASSPCGSAGANAAATIHAAPGGGIAAIHALASPHRAPPMTNAHAAHTKTATAATNPHVHAAHSGPAERATPKPKT
ncbi:MAG TPA: hypothetical protein VMI72_03325 [Roseiarcus sp.]|nr:hypothetical protein [Roseiarcus sp.]